MLKGVLNIGIFISVVLISILMIGSVGAIVRINEVELNPQDSCNDCTEWLELYSNHEVSLDSWRLVDKSGAIFRLNGTLNGYKTIKNLTISLNNADEQVFLYNSTSLVDSTPLFSDTFNDNRTWEFCSSHNWTLGQASPGIVNPCELSSANIDPPTNSDSNSDSGSVTNNTTGIYLDLAWKSDRIINNQEFEIQVSAFNLKTRGYDLRLWMEFQENSTIISEVYDDNTAKWISGNYYIDNFFSLRGNQTNSVRMRLKENYQSFSGTVRIYARLRYNDNGNVVTETLKTIKIISTLPSDNPIEESSSITTNQNDSLNQETSTSDSEVIVLKPKSQPSENSIVYKSRNEYIKEYSLYAIVIICLLITIAVLVTALRIKKKNGLNEIKQEINKKNKKKQLKNKK